MRLELLGVCSGTNQITDKLRIMALKETIIISHLARLLPLSLVFVSIAEYFVHHVAVLIANKHCLIIFPLDMSQPATRFSVTVCQECGFVIYSSWVRVLARGSVRYGQKRLTNADSCSSRHVAQLLPILSAVRTEGMVESDVWLVKEGLWWDYRQKFHRSILSTCQSSCCTSNFSMLPYIPLQS